MTYNFYMPIQVSWAGIKILTLFQNTNRSTEHLTITVRTFVTHKIHFQTEHFYHIATLPAIELLSTELKMVKIIELNFPPNQKKIGIILILPTTGATKKPHSSMNSG